MINNKIFNPIPSALVVLSPSLSGVVNIGATSYGINNGLNIPVTQQTRLLLVASITGLGLNLVNVVTGYISAGLAIL